MPQKPNRPVTRNFAIKLHEEEYRAFVPTARSTNNRFSSDSSSSSSNSSIASANNSTLTTPDVTVINLSETLNELTLNSSTPVKIETKQIQISIPDDDLNSKIEIEEPSFTSTMSNTTIADAFAKARKAAIPQFISPAIFKPSESDPEKYLRNFERTSIANAWTDELKITYFGSFLEGIANRWYEDFIDKNPDKNWKEVSKAFTVEFENKFSRNSAEDAFEEAKQKSNEPINEFFNRLRLLAHDYDPNMNDSTLIRKFEKGLAEGYLNYYKLLIDDRMDLSKLKIVVNKLTSMKINTNSSENAAQVRNSQDNSNSGNRDRYQSGNYRGNFYNNRQRNFNRNNPGQYYYRNNGQSDRREPCTICKRSGHSPSSCWYKPKGNSPANNGENDKISPNANGRQ